MLAALICLLAAGAPLELKSVGGHPMKYLVSLPEGWTAGKKWPAVVVIESANKDFRGTAEAFVRARGARPFLLLAPFVVTNGGTGQLSSDTYPYSKDDWAAIERAGHFAFDEAGIAAMMADARKLYGAEEKYFLAGWEAAGHTIWPLLFSHPDRLRAVALETPNWQGRWMSEERYAKPAGKLPVRVTVADVPEVARIVSQIDAAIAAARAHGIGPVEKVVVAKPHGPMAEEALDFFTRASSAR